MTTTRTLAALVAGVALTALTGLALTGPGGATALAGGPTDPTAAPAAVSVVAVADTASPTSSAGAPTAGNAARTAAADAARIARSHVGGGTVAGVEREVEHGRTVWEVDVRGATGTTRVHVDTATGTVTRVDDAGDRGRDDRGRHGGHDDGPGHDR